ncbi:hypothetical protein B7486_47295 [cyanobacterium TDX16]|nr:hypothetical protein B7486_47295 [cyanobacterium TDX16]
MYRLVKFPSAKIVRYLSSILTLVLWLLLVLPSPAYAWNKAGHMVTGSIAYSELQKNDPQALASVINLLKQNSDLYDKWLSQVNQNANSTLNPDQILFMQAARWSDDIRTRPQLSHPKWHYIDFPYKPASQPASVSVEEPDPENLLTAFQENLERVRISNNDSEKAIALSWLFHLTGDVHQPLHTTSLFATEYPQGDRGGNLFHIKVKQNSKPINLHKFWDDLILGSENIRTVRNRATQLRLNPSYSRSRLSELSDKQIDDWAKPESYELAKKVAYGNGTLTGSPKEESAPVLPRDYLGTAKRVAERRAVLAGYRLADLLQQVF